MGALCGRIGFGASTVLFGVVALIWRDSELWHRLHAAKLPFVTGLAWLVAIALVAGGLGMLVPRTVRRASGVLTVVYGIFTLACIYDIVAAPKVPGSYVQIFEELSVVCGAVALFAGTEADAARSCALERFARIAFGVCTVSFAWAQIVYLQYTASLVPAWLAPNQTFWTNLTTAAFALAAVAILTGRQAALALRLTALMLAIFGILVWLPKIATHPANFSDWSEFALNYLIAFAALIVAGVERFGSRPRAR